MKNVTLYSASAGTGKTYSICQEIACRIENGLDPGKILACTFTKKAAAELKSRVQKTLLEKGLVEQAAALELAAIGTVHSIGHRFISRFALRLGLSPDLAVLPEGSEAEIMKATLTGVESASLKRLAELEQRLSREQDEDYEREPLILKLIRLKRQNDISDENFKKQLMAGSARFTDVLTGGRQSGKGTFDDAVKDVQKLCATICRELMPQPGVEMPEFLNDLSRIAKYGVDNWKDIARLVDLKVGRDPKAKNAVVSLVQYASHLREHPGLAAECHEYMELLTERTLDLEKRYDKYKIERGYLDYTDMEARFYRLVKDPDFADELRSEIELVVVDEFQDSNPIQLAIFLALSELARDSIWVGDQKQTIYAFNGAAPDLMNAVWNDKRVSKKTLDMNRRSARGVVDLVNAVFDPVFGKESTMKAHNKPLAVAAERWILECKKIEVEAKALALGIAAFLERTGRRRSDIAVLARTHSWGRAVSKALEEINIPTAIELGGLLSSRECAAVLAGLRIVADRRDSLAAVTLLHMLDLSSSETPEWFARRLTEISLARGSTSNGSGIVPFANHPKLKALEENSYRHLSPSGAVAAVIQSLELGTAIGDWTEPPRRASQLDTLMAEVKKYEQDALDSGRSATLTGAIAHLEELADEGVDMRRPPQGLDAVQVLTYHGAKGLEWPVVILTQLAKVFEGAIFEPTVSGGDLKSGRPLEGRKLSLWPNPFNKSKHLNLKSDVAATPEGIAAQNEIDDESKRLLYVGFTRAKELLVLATRVTLNKTGDSHKHGWLSQLQGFDKILGNITNPGEHKLDNVHGQVKVTRVIPPIEPSVQPTLVDQRWIPVRASPIKTLIARYRNPSSEPGSAAKYILEKLPGDNPFPSEYVKLDPELFGRAVHAYFSALPSLSGLKDDVKLACAERILKGYGMNKIIDKNHLISAGKRLEVWVETKFPTAKWRTEVPITAPSDSGSQWNGTIDLLLELADGSVAVLDHKSFFGEPEHLKKRAAEYTGQLNAYSAALAACGRKVAFTALHLPLAGSIILMDGK